MSKITGTTFELIYASTSAGTAKNTFTTEAQINDVTGMGVQAVLPNNFFPAGPSAASKAVRIVARGILSSTGTPTYTFTVRGGAAANVASNPILLGTAALTTGSGVTNQVWEFEGDFVLQTPTAASTTATIRGTGLITSPGLNPTIAPIWGGAASPGTTATLNQTIDNFINFNVACSASSASNSIQLLQLLVYGQN